MTLESQVAPLALAQQMKELGFPQETCFGWFTDTSSRDAHSLVIDLHSEAADHPAYRQLCAAPTVAEMGKWLTAPTSAHGLEVWRRDGEYHIVYRVRDLETRGSAATLSEGLAVILIALAEAGALDPKRLR